MQTNAPASHHVAAHEEDHNWFLHKVNEERCLCGFRAFGGALQPAVGS